MSKLNPVVVAKSGALSSPIDPPYHTDLSQAQLQDKIDKIGTIDFSTTVKRAAALNKIKTLIPQTFDTDAAISILKGLNVIVSLSMAHVLNSVDYSLICGMINKCIIELRREGAIDENNSIESLVKNCPQFNEMFNKLKMTPLYSRLDRN
jgi:hypothetical protein